MADTIHGLLSFACGIGLFAVGLVHFCKTVLGGRWCDGDSCFGPEFRTNEPDDDEMHIAEQYLFWDSDNFFDDKNVRFRNTFSLTPKALGENFGVFLLAYAALKVHFRHQRDSSISFRQSAALMLLVGLFGGFPFAGGLGVIVGFACCLAALTALLLHYLNPNGSATLGLSLDASRPLGKCGNLQFPEGFFTFWNVAIIVMLVMTVINNFIHIGNNEFHHWCKDKRDETCIGPFLIWPEKDLLKSINQNKWGSVFSLDLNRALELWTPCLLVGIFLAFGMNSWYTTTFFLVTLAVFGAFGYGGNMGIIVGVMLCVGSVLSFLVATLAGNDTSARRSAVGGLRYGLLSGSDMA